MNLSLLSWNAQSILTYKKDMLLEYSSKNDLDVLCIQETWLHPYIQMKFKGYSVIRRDRIDQKGGGVIIGIRKGITFKKISFRNSGLLEKNGIELVAVKVFSKNLHALNIINIYNPHGNNKSVGTSMQAIIDETPGNEKHIIVGDFNAHSDVWCGCGTNNEAGNSLQRFMLDTPESCLLTPKDFPTRINYSNGSYTTIDLAFASPSLANSHTIYTVNEPTLFSDHNPYVIQWKQQDQESEPSSPRFSIQKANWSEFDEALKSMEIDKMLMLAEEVDQKIEIFQGKLLEAAEKTIPKNKHNLKGQKSTPWWNEDCEEAKKELKKRRQKYDRIPTLDRYIKVKRAHARFRKKVKEAKRHSWHTFVENLDFRESSAKVYRFIKCMNTRNQAREDNPPTVVNGETLVDNIDKANAGAEYLKNVIGRQDPFKDDHNRTIWKVKKVSQKKRMEDYNRPFTEREVNEVVKNLPNTTPGDDLIYPEFVKRLPEIWMKELLKIINIAWKSGYFPKIWKKGTAIMKPKPGKDSEKIENFRFITLLPVLGKVYERLVKNRL
ncbi:hypothetical protein QYM36_001103 [Artemia franciscana]|uniref:Endonuclease/exonuclease/phosphatase domain-containing protein n=1 Tax=Artemia franciscana TaxID=6661 RepID=A0AA88LJT4_ARTSF|nr:hypothetical protein QYM36_001103 [Artemia franciscana]